MLLRDLIYDDFDINCEYEVYYCEDDDITWDNGGIKIADYTNWHNHLDKYLDMKIGYMTIYNSRLIIEIIKE